LQLKPQDWRLGYKVYPVAGKTAFCVSGFCEIKKASAAPGLNRRERGAVLIRLVLRQVSIDIVGCALANQGYPRFLGVEGEPSGGLNRLGSTSGRGSIRCVRMRDFAPMVTIASARPVTETSIVGDQVPCDCAGEVAHPGRIVWTPDLTLTKAIQSARRVHPLRQRKARVTLGSLSAQPTISIADLAQHKPDQDRASFPAIQSRCRARLFDLTEARHAKCCFAGDGVKPCSPAANLGA